MTAVLLFRIAENKRRNPPSNSPDWLPYASYFAAMLMGRYLLEDLKIPLEKLDHRHFDAARDLIESQGETYFDRAINELGGALSHVLPPETVGLRKLSATFRSSGLLDYLP